MSWQRFAHMYGEEHSSQQLIDQRSNPWGRSRCETSDGLRREGIEEMIDQKMESYFADWAKREEVAESMVPLIGKLYRDYGVVTTIYGRSLVHKLHD